MKDAIRTILGKTISGVVVKAHSSSPRSQVFLIFSDDSYCEIYSVFGPISGTGGLGAGGRTAVLEYLSETSVVFETHRSEELGTLEDRRGDARRDPEKTGFSFAEERWIQVPPEPDPEVVVESLFEEVVAAFADRQDYEMLRGWRDHIQAYIRRCSGRDRGQLTLALSYRAGLRGLNDILLNNAELYETLRGYDGDVLR